MDERWLVGRLGPVGAGLFLVWIVSGNVAWWGCAPRGRETSSLRPVSGGPACSLRPEGRPFGVFEPGRLATLFARDRAAMLTYLFNGDGLWPKTADLCSRGRNALLDLELGPGASYELGLWGPAWDAPIYSVAVTNPFVGGKVTGTRFLATWPLVADGQTQWLRRAFELFLLARKGPRGRDQWRRLRSLATWTAVGRFRVYLCRMPPGLLGLAGLEDLARSFRSTGHCRGRPGLRAWDETALAVAAEWGRRLTGALVHRLLRSPDARQAAGLPSGPAPLREAVFLARLLQGDDTASRLLTTWIAGTETSAARGGRLFRSERYRTFRRRHLTACIQGQGCGLGLDAAEAIWKKATRTGRTALARSAEAAVRRLRFLILGWTAGLDEATRKVLEPGRRAYLELRAQVDADRARLARMARRWFASRGRKVVAARLHRTGDLLLSSSFYFETDHLEQTRAGFTHAALLEKLGQVAGEGPAVWQLDRVLGFFYVYPLERLTHSVTVELVEPARALAHRPRRYQWVRLRVPETFRFSSGAVSGKVTLLNLLHLLVARLRRCPHYYTLPGFFYSAASWFVAEPHNAKVFDGVWVEREYRGGRYRTLSPDRLESLKGKVLLFPVGLVPEVGSVSPRRQ